MSQKTYVIDNPTCSTVSHEIPPGASLPCPPPPEPTIIIEPAPVVQDYQPPQRFPDMRMEQSSYLHCAMKVNRRKVTLANAISAARRAGSEHGWYDSIVCRGTSGLLIAPSVADALEKNLIVVRKSEENHHSIGVLAGALFPSRYIIVDDLISSGETMRKTIYEMDKYADEAGFPRAVLVAIVLYRGNGGNWPEFNCPQYSLYGAI